MKEMIVILLSAILTQNFVLSKSLGICPFLGVPKKLDSAVGMSLAVTFVMVLATAAPGPSRPTCWINTTWAICRPSFSFWSSSRWYSWWK